jgi:uncharacterized short protein YbdD (DUF466 family)
MSALALRLRHAMTRTTAVVRRIIGVPDYERYAEHMRTRHPERTVLTREQFAKECLEKRYNQPGSRCC